MFEQVLVSKDLHKKDLKDNYQAAVTRLQEIRDTATGMDLAAARQALHDLSVIELRLLKALKDLLS